MSREDTLQELESIAHELNGSMGLVNSRIASFEKHLQEMDLQISYTLPCSIVEFLKVDWFLGFSLLKNGVWHLTVRTTYGAPFPLLKASRIVRINALSYLQNLVEELKEQAQAELRCLQEKTGEKQS